MCLQVPDQYGTIRAVSEGKGDEFLVGTSRNFILRGTFNDGFLVEVQVRPCDIIMTLSGSQYLCVLWCVQGLSIFACRDVFSVHYLCCDVFRVSLSSCRDVFRVSVSSCVVMCLGSHRRAVGFGISPVQRDVSDMRSGPAGLCLELRGSQSSMEPHTGGVGGRVTD